MPRTLSALVPNFDFCWIKDILISSTVVELDTYLESTLWWQNRYLKALMNTHENVRFFHLSVRKTIRTSKNSSSIRIFFLHKFSPVDTFTAIKLHKKKNPNTIEIIQSIFRSIYCRYSQVLSINVMTTIELFASTSHDC